MPPKKKRKIPEKERGFVKSFEPDPTTGERSIIQASGGRKSRTTIVNPNEESIAAFNARSQKIFAESQARKAKITEQFGKTGAAQVAAGEKGIFQTNAQGVPQPKATARLIAGELAEQNKPEEVTPTQTTEKKGRDSFAERLLENLILGDPNLRKDQTLLDFGALPINPATGAGTGIAKTAGGIAAGEARSVGGAPTIGARLSPTAIQEAGRTGNIASISAETIGHRLTRTAVAGTNTLQREQLLGVGTKTATRNFIGKPGKSGVNKLFSAGGRAKGVEVAMNTKTMTQAETILSGGIFSPKAMLFFGGWASSVFLGRWGQEEGPEAIAIPLRDLLKQATETGDFSVYDEYAEFAREISDPSIWREIMLWSPIAAIPGIETKMKGVQKGLEVIDATADEFKSELGQ